jgi:hypothetical protein
VPRGALAVTRLALPPAAEIPAWASSLTRTVTLRPARMLTVRLPTVVVPRLSLTVPLQVRRERQVTLIRTVVFGAVATGGAVTTGGATTTGGVPPPAPVPPSGVT